MEQTNIMQSAALTALFALIGAIFLFLISEFIRGYIIKPSIILREHIGTIIDRVIFFQSNLLNLSGNIDPEYMHNELRSSATQLRAKAKGILWYGLLSLLHLVPKKKDIEKAADFLTGLSNSTDTLGREDLRYNLELIEGLGQALKFKFIPDIPKQGSK